MSGDGSSIGDSTVKGLMHGVALGIVAGLTANVVDYLIGSHSGSDKEGKSASKETVAEYTSAAQIDAEPSKHDLVMADNIDDKKNTKTAAVNPNIVPCEMIPALQKGCSDTIYSMRDTCTSRYKHFVSVCNDLTRTSSIEEGPSVEINDSDLVLLPFHSCLESAYSESKLQSCWENYGKLLNAMDGYSKR